MNVQIGLRIPLSKANIVTSKEKQFLVTVAKHIGYLSNRFIIILNVNVYHFKSIAIYCMFYPFNNRGETKIYLKKTHSLSQKGDSKWPLI